MTTQVPPLPRRQPTPEAGWPPQSGFEPPVVAMPGSDSPVIQRARAETHESPIFSQLVREQAELLGSGSITVDNFSDFLGVANQVSLVDYGDTDVYTGPGGEPLDEGAARPLYEARTPEHWILGSQDARAGASEQADPETSAGQRPRPETLTAAQLPVVAKVFHRYGNMNEADIPEEQRAKLTIARQRVANTLGITDPSGLSLLDLEERIIARQALSEAVADGRFDPHFLPRLTRPQRAGRASEVAAVPPQAHAAPLSAGGRSAAATPGRATDPGRSGRRRRIEPSPAAGTDDRVIRSHRRDPRTDTQRIERRRQVTRVAISVAATATLSSVLKVADVVPGGSVGVGAVTGMVGMVLATRFNKELWGHLEGGRQKWKALGKAALLGAGLGAAVAAGTMLITDVASAGIDAIRGAMTDHTTATLHHLPNVAPDPGGGTTTPPPTTPTPHAFSAPMQTDSLGGFSGADGPDSNPWVEGTGYDAVGDRLAAEYQLATGHALDWSTINSHDYHNYVAQVLEQNHVGDGYSSVWVGSEHMSSGATLTIDPQKALEFLISQQPDVALSLVAA